MNTMSPNGKITVPQVAPYAPTQTLADRAQLLKVLAEPMRLSIIRMIADHRGAAVCACDFPDALGISQSTASHHLKKLTEAGLLSREQRGKWAWFSLNADRVEDAQRALGELVS